MIAPPSRTLYLATGGGAFAVHHPADPDAPGDRAAVLLVPPFGWDDVASYRSRRTWAEELAAAGHPVLRFDLPGTGDSAGGPDDPELVDAWIGAIADAAAWLRAESGRTRVAAIGLGLGGLLTLAAVARGAAIGELVLWGAPGRGRSAVRELRAFAKLGEGGAVPVPRAAGIVVNGHALRPATSTALGALDVAELELPAGLRALVLDRDGIAPDTRLISALEGSGAPVSRADGAGWEAMLDRPQDAVPPRAAFAAVGEWLAAAWTAGAEPAAETPAAPVGSADTLELDGLVERPLTIQTPAGETFGILAEPSGGQARHTVLLLNAGAIRRIGPNRMYVEAARRWGRAGIASLRLDVAGIGDADGDGERWGDPAAFHSPELIAQVEAAVTAMATRQAYADRPTLIGLCSGAHWAFQAALDQPGIGQIIMVNTAVLFWHDDLGAARDVRHYLSRAREPRTWLRLVRGDLSFGYLRANLPRMLRRIATAPLRLFHRARRPPEEPIDPVAAAFGAIREQGTDVLMLFVAEEPLYAELEGEDRLPELAELGVEVRRIAGDVPAHTLQPLPLQQEVHRLLDARIGLGS